MSAKQLIESASAVLFDFDGLIMDSEWSIYESWLRVFQAEGHDLPVETYVQCVGSGFHVWSPEKHLEDLTGKTFNWDKINDDRQVEIERDLTQAEALSGVNEIFALLQNKGTKVAVVSSSSHTWVDRWLDQLDLIKYTQEVVCRGDAPSIKPAPDLYLEAIKRFNVPAGECVVIEDSLNGIKAGSAAGCKTIAIPSRLTGVLNFDIADEVVSSLTELY